MAGLKIAAVNAKTATAIIHTRQGRLAATAPFDFGMPEFSGPNSIVARDFGSENEAALRDGTRQRGSGHGYYFSAESLSITPHWYWLGSGAPRQGSGAANLFVWAWIFVFPS